jgi:AraC-like DNA-binding protein
MSGTKHPSRNGRRRTHAQCSMTTNSQRSISAASILLETARERGVSEHALLAGTGVRPDSLEDATTTVSFDQEFRIIRNLLHHCGETDALGLEVGLRYRFTSIAPVGFALVSSPTFRSAFDIVLRYGDLNVSLVEIVLETEDKDLHIGFREERLPADLRRFAVERTMGGTLAIVRDLVGRNVAPLALEFNFPAPRDVSSYRNLTGTAAVFGKAKNLLVLQEEDVDLPLKHGNPVALRIAEEQCLRYLESWKKRAGVSARVRHVLAMQSRDAPTIGKVASMLHMSERSLRRRLQEEGTSFSALCEETRQAIAEQLLMMPRLPIEQISERLGYSETAAFIHAFKRWTGQSPRAYRLGRARREK